MACYYLSADNGSQVGLMAVRTYKRRGKEKKKIILTLLVGTSISALSLSLSRDYTRRVIEFLFLFSERTRSKYRRKK